MTDVELNGGARSCAPSERAEAGQGAAALPSFTATLDVAGVAYQIWDLAALARAAEVELASIPFAGRVLLEALLRAGELEPAMRAARCWAAGCDADVELAFLPARLVMQDYTGVPSLVDLAALRDRVAVLGGDPTLVNPVVPTALVVDHSVQVDAAGTPDAQAINEQRELARNRERYEFLRWAEGAFANLRVVPPSQGIVHQVNLEQLATVVAVDARDGRPVLVPDSVIGTDSHTTMVNGLGVIGWGTGGLEAEAIMLGLPIRTRVPSIVGVRLDGALPPGATATDLVLTLTERLRREGVVGSLLEWFGPAAARLGAADRCTIANMAPEYGAMAAYFPIDAETIRYLQMTGRTASEVARVDAYARRQQLLRTDDAPAPRFARVIAIDLGEVVPCVAGPSRPHQRVPLAALADAVGVARPAPTGAPLGHGSVAIAAITSCTSTSNPAAMIAAGLVARNAVRRGLRVPAHVKTSLAPGSRAVTRYLEAAGLLAPLEALGFHVVGYGCTTCNGGSGALAPEVSAAIARDELAVCAVLSGNRNFEGRIHPQVRDAFLASPPLVVALALAGHAGVDLTRQPVGVDRDGVPVCLAELWPDDDELAAVIAEVVRPQVFRVVEPAPAMWRALAVAEGARYAWRDASTYIQRPPYFDDARPLVALVDAPVLLVLGDDVTTDQLSPVSAISPASPAGRYLRARGVDELNSYGARRGNHEVMARAAFMGGASPRGDVFERAMAHGGPLVVLAGKRYGMGSSRDWAARGPWFLGVRAVLAESFERIHRANLVAMGIVPLQLPLGRVDLGLTGEERFTIDTSRLAPRGALRVVARRGDLEIQFVATACVDSADELAILRRGGVLPYLADRFVARGQERGCA